MKIIKLLIRISKNICKNVTDIIYFPVDLTVVIIFSGYRQNSTNTADVNDVKNTGDVANITSTADVQYLIYVTGTTVAILDNVYIETRLMGKK